MSERTWGFNSPLAHPVISHEITSTVSPQGLTVFCFSGRRMAGEGVQDSGGRRRMSRVPVGDFVEAQQSLIEVSTCAPPEDWPLS